MQRRIAARPTDLFLSFLPLAHAFERTVGYYLPMMAGARVAYARSIEQPRHDLRDVVEFYNRGGVPNEGLDPRIKPLGPASDQIDALVVFLQSLTGDNVETLMLDAYAAPIGDPE